VATTTLTPQQKMQLAQYLARVSQRRQNPQAFPTYESWLAQRTGVGNPSGQPLTYEQWMAQRAQATGQQPTTQQAPQQNSPMDTVTDYGKKKGEKWLTDKAETAILGESTPGAGLTETTQAAWNAPGLAASGAAPALGTAGVTTAASAAMVPTVAGGVATIPAGAAIPAGWVGVGSAASGGTIVAPTASAAAGGAGTAGGSSIGAAAGAAWPIAAAATAIMSGMNYAAVKKGANGTGLTKDEVRTVYDPWKPVADKIPGVKQFNNLYFGKLAPERFIFGKLLGSGKHEDQIYRDRVRKTLRDNNFTDTDHNIVFNDGTKFNMGLDGGYRDANGLRQFDVGADALQPGNWKGNIIANLNPLGRIIGGTRAKSAEDATGYFTKAAITGLDNEEAAMGRVRELYAKSGISADDARKSIDEMEKLGKDAPGGLDKQTADIYRHSLDVVYGGQPPAKQGSSSMMIPRVPPGQTNAPNPGSKTGWTSWMNQLPPGSTQGAPNFVGGQTPQGGQWIGPDGKPVTGIDPGRFTGNKFVPNPAPTTPAPIMIPKRSSTSSPGIGLDGRRISYGR